MEKMMKEKKVKGSWVYSPVILSQKSKELIEEVFESIKYNSEMANVEVKNMRVATVYNEYKNMSFELRFSSYGKEVVLYANDLEDFNIKFIEFLFKQK